MLYMVTYGNIYNQYTPNVSIYTSTMDPMDHQLPQAHWLRDNVPVHGREPRCASAPFPSQVDLGQGGVPGVGPPLRIAFSCAFITPTTMFYDTNNYSIHGVYKPIYN